MIDTNGNEFQHPGVDSPSIGIEQMAYAFWKVIYGIKPGDENWNALDQAALNAAASQCIHYEIREGRLYPLPYDVMKGEPYTLEMLK